MPRLQLMPRELIDGDILNPKSICRVLQYITHGLTTRWRKTLKIKRDWRLNLSELNS